MLDNNTTPTETCISLNETDFVIRQDALGTPINKSDMVRMQYTVDIEANGVTHTVLYHGSHDDYVSGKDTLSERDFLHFFECVISDAIAGTYACDEFFAEFGYDNPCVGLRAFRACKDTLEKFVDMGISEDDLYDMSSELQDVVYERDEYNEQNRNSR